MCALSNPGWARKLKIMRYAIASYSIVRLDRNRRGGGVIIKDSLNFKSISPSRHDLELIFVSITLQSMRDVCIGTFYRPPSAPVSTWDSLFRVISTVNPSLFSNFLLLGDFNVNVLKPSPQNNHLTTVFSLRRS